MAQGCVPPMEVPACSPSDPGQLPHSHPEMSYCQMMFVPGTRPEHQTPAPTAGRHVGLASSGETLGQDPLIVLTQPYWTPGEGLASNLGGSTPTIQGDDTEEDTQGISVMGWHESWQDLPATHSVPTREGCLQDKKPLAQRADWHRKDLHLETAALRPFCTILHNLPIP